MLEWFYTITAVMSVVLFVITFVMWLLTFRTTEKSFPTDHNQQERDNPSIVTSWIGNKSSSLHRLNAHDKKVIPTE